MVTKRAKVSAFLVAIVIGASGWAASAAPFAAQTDSSASPAVIRFLALPYVTEDPDGTIIVDFSDDPDAASAALESVHEALDGREVSVIGLDVRPPDVRRVEDAQLSKDDQPVREPFCPDVPRNTRSTDGSTVAYLGCDPVTGSESTGRPQLGDLDESLATAFDQVLSARLPGIASDGVEVSVSEGAVRVDLPNIFADQIGRLPASEGWDLASALIFTAYSNGRVETVQFLIGGDCMKFALLTGGDVCSTISLDKLPK